MNRQLTENLILSNIKKIKEFMYSKKFEPLDIYSRQYYKNIILSMFNNYSSTYSFMFGDFDKLNQINKLHGMKIGDISLFQALKIIKLSLPKNTLISRVAGDEFSFIFPDKTKKDCLEYSKKIASNLDTYRAYTSGLTITVASEDSTKTSSASKLEQITEKKMNTIKNRKNNLTHIDFLYDEKDIPLEDFSSPTWKTLNQKIYNAVKNHIADLRFSDSFEYTSDDFQKESLYIIEQVGKMLEAQCEIPKSKHKNHNYKSKISHEEATLLHNLVTSNDKDILKNIPDNKLEELLTSSSELSDLLIRNPLSKLFNKEYFNTYLLPKISSTDSEYQVLFFSNAGVKTSNTAYGHDATDLRLKEAGNFLINKLSQLRNFENIPFDFSEKSNYLTDFGGGNYLAFIEKDNSLQDNEINRVIDEYNSDESNLKFAYATLDSINKSTPESLNIDINKLHHQANMNKDLLKHNNIDYIDIQNAFVTEFQDCITYFLDNIPNSSTDITVKQQFLKNLFNALINESSKIKSNKDDFER